MEQNLPTEHKKLIDLLQEKWFSYVGETEHSQPISLMLEEQKKHLDHLVTDDPKTVAFFSEHFGTSWDEHLLRGYAKALKEHALLDFFPPQPLVAPTGSVAYFEMVSNNMDQPVEEGKPFCPEIKMNLRVKAVTARTQAFGNVLSPMDDDVVLTEDMRRTTMEAFFEAIIHRKMQELVGMLLHNNTSALTFDQQEGETLHDAITQCAYRVHKRTMRGPSNRVVCNPKLIARVTNPQRWHEWTDPEFDDTGVLTWYSGPSLMDQPLIWAPYLIKFHTVEVERKHEDKTNMITVVKAGWRDATFVANAAMIQSIAIKQPGTV